MAAFRARTHVANGRFCVFRAVDWQNALCLKSSQRNHAHRKGDRLLDAVRRQKKMRRISRIACGGNPL